MQMKNFVCIFQDRQTLWSITYIYDVVIFKAKLWFRLET